MQNKNQEEHLSQFPEQKKRERKKRTPKSNMIKEPIREKQEKTTELSNSIKRTGSTNQPVKQPVS